MKVEFARYTQQQLGNFTAKRSGGFVNGYDNLFPDYLDGLYNASVTHQCIINDLTSYIVGKGLKANNPQEQALITKHFPTKKLKKIIKLDLIQSTKSLEVLKDEAFNITSVNVALPKQFRVSELVNGEPTQFIYKEDWRSSTKKQHFNAYSYECQNQKTLLWAYDSGTFPVPYGRPYYMSGLNAIELEAGIYLMHNHGVQNGMFPTMIIDREVSSSEDQESTSTQKIVDSAAGPANAGKVIDIKRAQGDSQVNITTPNLTGIDKVYDTQYQTSEAGITKAHGLPSASLIAGMNFKPMGFSSPEEEMQWALNQWMQKTIQPYRADFLEDLDELFRDIGINGVEFIDEESRNQAEEELSSRFNEFGVGGVQGILGIQSAVSEGTITPEAGESVLNTVYGFSPDESRRMISTGKPTTPEGVDLKDAPQTNDILTNMTGRQLQGIERIVRKYKKKQLDFNQASLMLKNGYGFNEDEVKIWLNQYEVLELKFTELVQNIDDLIALGEDAPEGYTEVSRVDYSKESEEELDNQIQKLELTKLASTGTARPNAKSQDDGTTGNVQFKVRYRYEGRRPAQREFCRKMLEADKLYRKEDIERMSTANASFAPKGQSSYSIFDWKGGVNCYHKWERVTFVKKGLEGSIDTSNPRSITISESMADERGMNPDNKKVVGIKPINTPTKGRLN